MPLFVYYMKAIILGYKVGYCLSPLTQVINQSFLKFKTTALIELQLQQLLKNDIKDIYIIVGYRQEMFNELITKYNIKLITYPDYALGSELQALTLVKEYLDNSYIIDGNSVIFRLNKATSSTIYTYEQACNGRTLSSMVVDEEQVLKEVKLTNQGIACTYSGVCYLDEKDCFTFVGLLEKKKQGQVIDILKQMELKVCKMSSNSIMRIETMKDYRNSLQIYEKYWQKK